MVLQQRVASRARETPILDDASFYAQAQCLRHLVFKTIAPVIENSSFFVKFCVQAWHLRVHRGCIILPQGLCYMATGAVLLSDTGAVLYGHKGCIIMTQGLHYIATGIVI